MSQEPGSASSAVVTPLVNLIQGRGTEPQFNRSAFAAARAKQAVETEKRAVASAFGLLDGFVYTATELRQRADDLMVEAQKAENSAKEASSALEYLDQSANPLPFFRATFNIEGGRRWCEANGFAVPDVKDTSSAWYIQD